MKLAGLRILDLSSFLPGPYLTLALADHGAEVIKIERRDGGDPGRRLGAADGEHTVFFRNLNRGKKSIALDLKDPADRAAFLALADTADVVIESNRPGVAGRLGIDYATLAARNPRLVYCAITAFGQDGPLARRPAHELAIEAMAGVLSTQVDGAGRPILPAVPAADYLAGLQGLAGVLMALLARERTGRGDYIDISMHEAMMAATLNVLGPTLAEGRQPVPSEERTTGGSAFYRAYSTGDGRDLVLAGQEEKFVVALLSELGRPELAPLCETPGGHQQPVVALLETTFGAMTLADAGALLDRLDMGWAPVKTFPEALADEQLSGRDFVLKDEDGRRHLASPIRFRDEPARLRFEAPALDADRGLFVVDLG